MSGRVNNEDSEPNEKDFIKKLMKYEKNFQLIIGKWKNNKIKKFISVKKFKNYLDNYYDIDFFSCLKKENLFDFSINEKNLRNRWIFRVL